MRKLCAVVAVLAIVPFLTAGGGDEKTIADVTQALQRLNDAFEKGDVGALKTLMTADHVSVTLYYGGPMKRDDQIAVLKELKFAEYKPGKMSVRLLGADTALITYPLTTKGTYKGNPLPAKNFASALWVKRDGRWIETYYQETALDAK